LYCSRSCLNNNNRSYESFVNSGFADNIPRSITGPRARMQQFLNKVDIRKGPIERTVRMIVRLRAPDWSTEKNLRKEFVYYTEDRTGNDWLGIPIDPFCEHIEGKYTEVIMKPKLDEGTGEHSLIMYFQARENRITFPLQSDKDSIKFYIKFGTEDSPDSFQVSTRKIFGHGKGCVNTSIGQLMICLIVRRRPSLQRT